MVSYSKFYNAVRSYNYRIRLLSGINDLEKKIYDYMNDENLKKILIPGYYIDISEGMISVNETTMENLNQLHLEFGYIARGNQTTQI